MNNGRHTIVRTAGNMIGVAMALAGTVFLATAKEDLPMPVNPDYSRLYLKGDDHAKDSFSLTLQAVARMYGIDVDYETVYALSGNGFAPGIHPPEDCRQLQRTHDRGQCLDIVAARPCGQVLGSHFGQADDDTGTG